MIGAMARDRAAQPKVKVTAIVCATENMPRAKRKSRETCRSPCRQIDRNHQYRRRRPPHPGRRLCYARQLGCTHLVDAATLTGAVVVALGYVNAGIFASTDELYERFAKANQQAGEKMWRLPLTTNTRRT